MSEKDFDLRSGGLYRVLLLPRTVAEYEAQAIIAIAEEAWRRSRERFPVLEKDSLYVVGVDGRVLEAVHREPGYGRKRMGQILAAVGQGYATTELTAHTDGSQASAMIAAAHADLLARKSLEKTETNAARMIRLVQEEMAAGAAADQGSRPYNKVTYPVAAADQSVNSVSHSPRRADSTLNIGGAASSAAARILSGVISLPSSLRARANVSAQSVNSLEVRSDPNGCLPMRVLSFFKRMLLFRESRDGDK